jgi:protein arginine kinase activator
MKKCRRCSKPATLHITEIHDGHAVAVHLCETCAHEYLENEGEEEVSNPAAELAAKLEALVSDDDEESQACCSNCGISFAEFRAQGRLGCPNCYVDFRQDLLPLLENIHEEAVHQGKRPLRSPGQTEDQARLIHLRTEQRDAIGREDYEAAAELRDAIANIEATLLRSSGHQNTDE